MTTTETTTVLKTVAEALYRKAGYVPFLWHIDDVRMVIEDHDIALALTDAECLEVLENVRENVPADLGMCFDAIAVELECWADNSLGSAAAMNAVRDKLDRISTETARLAAEMAAVLAEMQSDGMSGRAITEAVGHWPERPEKSGATCPSIIGGQP